MAKTDFQTIDEYIATHPQSVQQVLRLVRTTIQAAIPEAEEVISYQIPAYKLHGSPVIYFAGWKQHFSLYPATGQVTEVFKEELAPYKVSKGTIRFPLTQAVPVQLITDIAKLRATEAAQKAEAKKTAKKRT